MTYSEIGLSRPEGELPLRVFHPEGYRTAASSFIWMRAGGATRSMACALATRNTATSATCQRPTPRTVRTTRRCPLDEAANSATTVEMSIVDTGAIVAYARNNGVRRLGTVGYCMRARHALGALASYPETIGAAACLHWAAWYGRARTHRTSTFRVCGDLRTSPLPPTPRCAQGADRGNRPSDPGPVAIEHFSAAHGWIFLDRWCYEPTAAERVWAKVLRCYASSFCNLQLRASRAPAWNFGGL
jgi:dienelactone hydrolase